LSVFAFSITYNLSVMELQQQQQVNESEQQQHIEEEAEVGGPIPIFKLEVRCVLRLC
jgi:hypothetical protein